MFKRWFGKEESGDRIAADAIAAYERSHDEFDVIRRLKQALERGLRELPLDRAYTYLGAAYGDVGMHDEAEQAYETALTHNPKNSTALSNLGLSLQRRGEFERCRELFERAIAAKPNNGYAHNNLGALLLRQGACREARPILERATEFDPTLAVAFANLARCCARLGDFPAAQAAFQQAGRRGYAGLEGLQRELEEARLALPAVYFDGDAFFRLVEQLLPGQTAVHDMLRRAVSKPEELHRELTAAGRMLFMTDYEVSNGLPWLLLCDELERQGLAVRGASRSLEKWVELVLDAVGKRPSRAPLVVAGAISSALRSFADDEEHESEEDDALEAFFNELTRDGTLVLLRLWTNQTQAILCPLERSAWELAAYPSSDGASGIGRVDLLGHAQPRRAIEHLN